VDWPPDDFNVNRLKLAEADALQMTQRIRAEVESAMRS
jgi:hypothetical protein